MATRTIRIEVTADDIATGKPREYDSCMVALAARRVLGPTVYAGGFGLYDSPSLDASNRIADFPFDVRERVRSFDLGYPVQPFAFEVEVSAEAVPA